MKEPLLSVIIPYYNIDPILLGRCLESVRNQQLKADKLEVVVVNDGSKEFPHNTLACFNDIYIRYIYQDNMGLGGARNTGISAAKGKYILFLDADDYLFADVLPACLNILEENKLDIFTYRFLKTYALESEHSEACEMKASEMMSGAEYMYTHNTFGGACFYIFSKEMVVTHHIRFTPGIYHEDEEFTPKLYFFAKRVMSANLMVYAYYQRPDSIVNKKDQFHLEKRFRDFKGVIGRLCEFKKQNAPHSSELQLKGLERKLVFLSGDYLINMIRHSCCLSYITREMDEMRQLGLYPLPGRKYSFKYSIFRLLANHKQGIRLLYLAEYIRYKRLGGLDIKNSKKK